MEPPKRKMPPPARTRTGLPRGARPGLPNADTKLDLSREAAPDLLAGEVIDGRYRLVELIGEGAMGAVYRAEQLKVGRDVAVKLLHPGLDDPSMEDAVRRFETEARTISQLRHPNTLKLFDFGRSADGGLYLVTELLSGMTLEEELELQRLDEGRALRVLHDVAEALSEAHAMGIVHRDVKPRNIFLDKVGGREIVKVLDFGLAKLAGSPTRTAAGVTVGSPSYMSPEQAMGEEVTPLSDLYSLGVSAYECLAGAPPFTAPSVQALLFKHVHDDPPRFSQRSPPIPVHPEIEALVLSLLHKQPERRAPSAQALAEQLEELSLRLFRAPGLKAASSGPRRALPEPEPPDPRIGSSVEGWRLESLLGAGAVARVYSATREGRAAAVKVLSDESMGQGQWLSRLRREAELLRELRHPNIVVLLGSGTTADGHAYLVMEQVQGRSLKEALEQDGPFAPPRAARVAVQAASALALAHRRGVVHRDMKPSNVMLASGSGKELVKLLDFGLARHYTGADATALTKREALLGTPRYMAPEQIEAPSSAGPPADVYALGGVLYAMISGRPPFSGPLLEVLVDQRLKPPPPLPPAAGLEKLALRMLEKQPERRPDAEAVVQEILRLGLAKDVLLEPATASLSVPVDLLDTPPTAGFEPSVEQASSDTSPRTPSAEASAETSPSGNALVIPVLEEPTAARPKARGSRLGASIAVGLVAAAAAIALLSWQVSRRASPPQAAPLVPAGVEQVPAAHPKPEVARVEAQQPGASPAEPGGDPTARPLAPADPEAKADPAAKRRAPSKQSAPAPAVGALRRELARALVARALLESDLAASPSTRELYQSFKAAARGGDGAAAKTALDALKAAMAAMPIDAALVKSRLERAARLLAARAEQLGAERTRLLEKRLFDASRDFSRAKDEAARAAVLEQLESFEQQLEEN